MSALVASLRLDTVRQWMPVLTLVILCAIVGAITPQFLTVDSLLVLAADTATLFVLATGQTFVIMLGGIDLSIQSMAAMSDDHKRSMRARSPVRCAYAPASITKRGVWSTPPK